jgi:hypothetical protein
MYRIMYNQNNNSSLLLFRIILLATSMTLVSCIDDAPPLPKPAAPVFIDRQSDTLPGQRGIRSAYNQNGIYLEWNLMTDLDVSEYQILRTSSIDLSGRPVSFTAVATLQRLRTNWVDLNVVPQQTYFYRIRAVTRFNSSSDPAELIPRLSLIESFAPGRLVSPIPRGTNSVAVVSLGTDSVVSFIWNPRPILRYTIKVYEAPDFESATDTNCVMLAWAENTGVGQNEDDGAAIPFRRRDVRSLQAPWSPIGGTRRIGEYKVLKTLRRVDEFGAQVRYQYFVTFRGETGNWAGVQSFTYASTFVIQ